MGRFCVHGQVEAGGRGIHFGARNDRTKFPFGFWRCYARFRPRHDIAMAKHGDLS